MDVRDTLRAWIYKVDIHTTIRENAEYSLFTKKSILGSLGHVCGCPTYLNYAEIRIRRISENVHRMWKNQEILFLTVPD